MAGGYSAPGVYKREIDLSDILVATGISNGGTVIRAQQGPIRRPVLVTNDKEFIETFGKPYYVSGTSTNKLVPEFGYGAYGALEFFKESNTLFVVRAYDANDAYASCNINTSGTSGAVGGISNLDTTTPEVFDTKDRITAIDKYSSYGVTDKLVVSYIGPGIAGNDYAVTIETLNPLSDWLYNYDEYPIVSSATLASVSAANPNGGTYEPIWFPSIWQQTNGSEVYKYFPLASEVVKVKVYAKPTDKNWTDLYSNSADAQDGKIRMQPLEVFYGSMTPMLDNDGNELFIEKQINGRSKFIYVNAPNGSFVTSNQTPSMSWTFSTGAPTSASWKLPDYTDNSGYYVKNTQPESTSRLVKLQNGAVSVKTGLTGDSEFWEYFNNREELPVSILMNPSHDATTKMAVANVCSSRKDCVVASQVGAVDIYNYQDIINSERYGYPAPSYVALYSGYSKIYDKFNDKYVYLPNSIFGASIMARVDNVSAPWFAPAGTARATLSVLDQNKVFSTDQIGRMYDKNINSVKLVQGAGFVIWGQKTAQLKTTALDRINVRRNLIYMQINIENALNQFIFENNTQQTRLRVYSIIDEFLNNIKASDGLYSYEVVCDTTNNTPAVIDSNQLNVDIYVQPTKAIEFIQFTTVITRTGVNFGDIKLKYA